MQESTIYHVTSQNFTTCISDFFLKERSVDLVFICKDGVKVYAHKVLIASVSEFMGEIIKSSHEGVTYVSLPDVSFELVRISLRLLYYGVVKVNLEELVQLKETISFLGFRMCNAEVEAMPTSNDVDLSAAGSTNTGIETEVVPNNRHVNTDFATNETSFENTANPGGETVANNHIPNTAINSSSGNTFTGQWNAVKRSATADFPTRHEHKKQNNQLPNNSRTNTCLLNPLSYENTTQSFYPSVSDSTVNHTSQTLLHKYYAKIVDLIYEKHPYLNKQIRKELADYFGISTMLVNQWFIRRRQKDGLALTGFSTYVRQHAQPDLSLKSIFTELSLSRDVYTKEVEEKLEYYYKISSIPDDVTVATITKETGLSIESLHKWFAYRLFRSEDISLKKNTEVCKVLDRSEEYPVFGQHLDSNCFVSPDKFLGESVKQEQMEAEDLICME